VAVLAARRRVVDAPGIIEITLDPLFTITKQSPILKLEPVTVTLPDVYTWYPSVALPTVVLVVWGTLT